MNSWKRVSTVLLCVLMAFAVVVSSAYVASNAGHTCVGRDCDVCEHIAMASTLLYSLALLGLLVGLLLLAEQLHQRLVQGAGFGVPAWNTPVGWKVRLNN